MPVQTQKTNCPVCGTPEIQWASGEGDFKKYNCPRCGIFRMSRTLEINLLHEHFTGRQRAITSSLIRENPSCTLTTDNYSTFFDAKDIPVLEKIDRLLLIFANTGQETGPYFMPKLDEELLAQTWTLSYDEFRWLMQLATDLYYIKFDGRNYYIAPKGWERLAELEAPNVESTQGFVAMCFKSELKAIYDEAIHPAIKDAGYMPFRIDDHEHIGKIDDEIIRQIRRSRFVVADLTEERCNVHYEAGFAHGLGIPIFYTARKDEKLHFDIRQYNCIFWEKDKPEIFKAALAARIEATLGQGKHNARTAS